jgi:aldose 1-epimerase
MYTITELSIGTHSYIELVGPKGTTKAQICLTQGARLCKLIFEDKHILASLHPDDYTLHYDAAVLFPFANRIKNGTYLFKDVVYQLPCNEPAKNNAIHGLVYNKTFTVKHKEMSTTHAAVTLVYEDAGLHQGFPFKYSMSLTYTLHDHGLGFAIEVVNNDHKAFPFTLGWHPYFRSKNLADSHIHFNSNTRYKTDEQKIIIYAIAFHEKMPWSLKGQHLDDGFALQSDTIMLYTPAYALTIKSSVPHYFLQLYTPPQANLIAIEPMTGIANSFNNKVGLQTLAPNAAYSLNWDLSIKLVSNKIPSNTFTNT